MEINTKTKNEIPESISLILEALRSGNYKQTSGSLQDSSGFCCLGVVVKVVQSKISEKEKIPTYELEGGDLKNFPSVLKFINFLTPDGAFTNSKAIFREELGIKNCRARSLVNLNDDYNLTFLQIADFIEDNWKILTRSKPDE
jgi:hypothetical protein